MKSKLDIKQIAIDLAAAKNYTVTFLEEYPYNNLHNKVQLICEKGHVWSTEIKVLKNGHGCASCIKIGKKRSEESIEKARKTCLNKYGGNSPSCSDIVKQKKKETSLKNYGVDNPSKNRSVREKAEATNETLYGVKHAMQNKTIKLKSLGIKESLGTIRSAERLLEYFKGNNYFHIDNYIKTDGVLDQFHDVDYGWFENKLDNVLYQGGRHPKRYHNGGDIIPTELLYSCKYHNTQLMHTKFRPDYIDEDKKLIIEADGLFWHSEKRLGTNFKEGVGVDRQYHFRKYEAYNKLGYKFLSFTEWEIKNKTEIVKSMIANKLGVIGNKIGARECKKIYVSSKIANEFFVTNHLMGRGSGKTIALTYDGEIVCAIRYIEKKSEIHISRFACKTQWSVVGAYSRLLKDIIYLKKPIVNYVDRRHGDGEHLSKQGFEKVGITIGFWWTDGMMHWNRRKWLGNSGYAVGLEKFWDYGQIKYVLKPT